MEIFDRENIWKVGHLQNLFIYMRKFTLTKITHVSTVLPRIPARALPTGIVFIQQLLNYSSVVQGLL